MPNDPALAYSYIRMSTNIQLKGHSKQRQLEKSADYAKAHNLRLVDDGRLEDIGVSAFKGLNVTAGALGTFLHAVEQNQVPAGSYLLVESLDRLSRQEIGEATTLFLRIIKAGINIVSLQDERVYRAGQVDLADLIISLTILSRAHEESQLKSQRVGDAWARNRSRATSRPLTKWCPAWLRLSNDRSHYEIIPDRAAVVRSIFDDAVNNIGIYVITRRLNQKRVPVWGNSNGWHASYIAKILSNRAVIGEFQPHKYSSSGHRVPAGEAIKGYFPHVIDDELFYRAQKARSERRVGGRGRKGKYVSNLFSGLTTCVYCHSKVVMENKGPPPKGGTFLVCGAAKRGLGCVTTGWRYEHFETSFLAFVDEVDLPNLIEGSSSDKQDIDDAIQSLEGELTTVQQEAERVYQLHRVGPEVTLLIVKLKTLQQRENGIRQQLDEKQLERTNLQATESELYQSKHEIKSLISRLRNQDDEDLYKLRSQVAARIRGLVREIRVAPVGVGPVIQKEIMEIESDADLSVAEKKRTIQSVKRAQDWRSFEVAFKDGNALWAFPRKDDPSKFISLSRTFDKPGDS